MIPMRDGVKLQTVILAPLDAKGPLPILMQRTPYGVPDRPFTRIPLNIQELAADGYIFVFQNLRGRFKSEGTFTLSEDSTVTPGKGTIETRDAYDTIDWLVKNVPANNGRVGIYGVSYDGLTAGVTLLRPASRPEGGQRAGVAHRPVDERRRPSLRRAAPQLRLRICGA